MRHEPSGKEEIGFRLSHERKTRRRETHSLPNSNLSTGLPNEPFRPRHASPNSAKKNQINAPDQEGRN